MARRCGHFGTVGGPLETPTLPALSPVEIDGYGTRCVPRSGRIPVLGGPGGVRTDSWPARFVAEYLDSVAYFALSGRSGRIPGLAAPGTFHGITVLGRGKVVV